MANKHPEPKTPSFEDVVAGAKRAAERVRKWPDWMKELSPMTASLSSRAQQQTDDDNAES
jgi:hypothetical protein